MKKHRFDKYDLCAGGIIVSATLLRFILILLTWPAAFNDEATIGLMALHIAYHGAHPLLYYGQNYLGSLEAYLGAAFFKIFGPSTVALRVGLIPIFALFLTCLYLLASLVYSKGLAIFSIIVVGLGAPDEVFRELLAEGGTPELFFFTTLLLLLTVWLALTSNSPQLEQHKDGEKGVMKRPGLSRLLLYGAWGAIAGLDMWSHLLCVPFVLGAGLFLALFCRKELRLAALSLLTACLLIGVSPLLIYNVTVPLTSPNQLSVYGVGGYHEASYPPPVSSKNPPRTSPAPGPVLQVAGTLLVAIPVATGGIALCPISQSAAWPLPDHPNRYFILCSSIHGAWSLGLLALLFVAVAGAVRSFRLHWNAPPGQERSLKQRREAIRQAARLMILAGPTLTLLIFIASPIPAGAPWTSARYLVGFLIAVPALLYPLWEKRDRVQQIGHAWMRYFSKYLRFALLLLIFLVSLLGTITIFTGQVSVSQATFRRAYVLIGDLRQLGATHIYTDYNDCDRIAYLSNEQIICAVLDTGLKPGLDRYFPYREMVARWPNPFYVFSAGSAQAQLFEIKAGEQHITYLKLKMYGYVVYKPERRVVT